MLSTTEKRYLDICIAQIASRESLEVVRQKFGVSRSVADRAIRWGNDRDLFRLDSTEKLRHHVAELRAVLEQVESALALHMRKPSNGKGRNWRPHAFGISSLARCILDYRTRIMELEGVYKQVVSHEHSGSDGGPIRVQYEIVQIVDAPGTN